MDETKNLYGTFTGKVATFKTREIREK